MSEPRDQPLTHLIVVGIDLSRTLAALGHDKQGKDLQDAWTTVSAWNNGALVMGDHQAHMSVRMLCDACKHALTTVAKHYGGT